METLSVYSSYPQIRQIPENILLCDTYIAGTAYTPYFKELKLILKKGMILGLRRDPKNQHDDWAIKVILPTGSPDISTGIALGYVPHTLNQIPANLLDAGKILYAIVTDITPTIVTIKLMLKE